jgi:NADH dehydrogenase/NADH:ubiquinone oxidoreductase subunit G
MTGSDAPVECAAEPRILRICVGGPNSIAGAELDEDSVASVVKQVEEALAEQTNEEGDPLSTREERVEAICGSLMVITGKIAKASKSAAKALTMEAVAQAVWLVATGPEYLEQHPPGVVVYCDPSDEEEEDKSSTVRIMAYADTESFDEVVAAMKEAGAAYGPDGRRNMH